MPLSEEKGMENRGNIPEGKALEEAMNQAYRLYQDNVRAAGERIFQLTKGAREGLPEKELLGIALEALDRCRFPDPSGDEAKEA